MTEMEHERADELLPWLVNGSLDGEEARTVEGHLADCVTCRRRQAELRLLAEAVAAEVTPTVSAQRSLELLRPRLNDGVRQAPRPRRAARWASVAAAASVAIALLAWGWMARPRPAFRTLAAPEALAAEGPQLRVLFTEDASEREIRGLLHEIGGEIVAGPTPLGLFTIELPRGSRPSPVVERLRAHPRVRFVEWVRGGERP